MLRPDQRAELERWAMQVLPKALGFARSLVRDPTRADDLVQESLFRLLRKANDYDLVRDGDKLLFKTISNLCISESNRRRELTSLGEEVPFEDSAVTQPLQELEAAELDAAVTQALQTLAPLQRAAIELRALGYDNKAIADVLEVSPSNVGVLVFRGRQELLERLGKLVDS